MIELIVKDYCGNCQEFEPIVDQYYDLGDTCNTFIHCEHEGRCRNMYKFIKSQKKGDSNERSGHNIGRFHD